MLACLKTYLKITGTTYDKQLNLFLSIAKSLAAGYIAKPIEIGDVLNVEFGKIYADDELFLAQYPIYSVAQLRVSTSYKFDTSSEYDEPTVLFIDPLKGKLKLDEPYSGDYRAKYKAGYDFIQFDGETIVCEGKTITFTGVYNINDAIDLLNDTFDNVTVSYSETTNLFTFVETSTPTQLTIDIVFSSSRIANLFSFQNLSYPLSNSHTGESAISWFPDDIKNALLMIADKIFDISKATAAQPKFRHKKIVHQQGFQTEFTVDDIPVEAKSILDKYMRVYL